MLCRKHAPRRACPASSDASSKSTAKAGATAGYWNLLELSRRYFRCSPAALSRWRWQWTGCLSRVPDRGTGRRGERLQIRKKHEALSISLYISLRNPTDIYGRMLVGSCWGLLEDVGGCWRVRQGTTHKCLQDPTSKMAGLP